MIHICVTCVMLMCHHRHPLLETVLDVTNATCHCVHARAEMLFQTGKVKQARKRYRVLRETRALTTGSLIWSENEGVVTSFVLTRPSHGVPVTLCKHGEFFLCRHVSDRKHAISGCEHFHLRVRQQLTNQACAEKSRG